MEEYILLCLDCHEIFPGKENHTCRRNARNHFEAAVDERVSTFDATIIGFSESCVGDGTYNPTPFEESTTIISTAEKILSDDGRRERKSILATATQENVAFGYSYGSMNVEQQIENYRDGLFVIEPELWTSIPRATPVLQDTIYNPCTDPDVANSCISDDEPMEVNIPSTSNWNVGDSAVISSGWDLIDQCEPMDLEAHRRPEDGQFVCPFCGKIVRRKDNFEVHYRSHTGEKPHACDLCDKTFNSKGNLTAHRRSHTGEKPCECDVCGYKCNDVSNLERHRIIHTGEKPFECDVCGHKCNRQSDLERHRITHTGETPHECPICGKGFTRLYGCKRHIENVHRKN